LLVSPKVNPNQVYVTTTPNKLGRIPLRKEMEIKIWDYVVKAAFVVLAWEQIGFGIHNTYGVSRLEFGSTKKSDYGVPENPTVMPTPNDLL